MRNFLLNLFSTKNGNTPTKNGNTQGAVNVDQTDEYVNLVGLTTSIQSTKHQIPLSPRSSSIANFYTRNILGIYEKQYIKDVLKLSLKPEDESLKFNDKEYKYIYHLIKDLQNYQKLGENYGNKCNELFYFIHFQLIAVKSEKTLYRIEANPHFLRDLINKEEEVGIGFCSTTTKEDFNSVGIKGAKIVLKLKSGQYAIADISNISKFPEEKEVLLGIEHKLKVTNIVCSKEDRENLEILCKKVDKEGILSLTLEDKKTLSKITIEADVELDLQKYAEHERRYQKISLMDGYENLSSKLEKIFTEKGYRDGSEDFITLVPEEDNNFGKLGSGSNHHTTHLQQSKIKNNEFELL
jgi:hypothetical protein